MYNSGAYREVIPGGMARFCGMSEQAARPCKSGLLAQARRIPLQALDQRFLRFDHGCSFMAFGENFAEVNSGSHTAVRAVRREFVGPKPVN